MSLLLYFCTSDQINASLLKKSIYKKKYFLPKTFEQ